MSGPRFVGGPIVRLVRRVPRPAIKRVVDGQPSFELGKIVGKHAGQAKRDRQQSRRFPRASINSRSNRKQTDVGQASSPLWRDQLALGFRLDATTIPRKASAV